MNEAARGHRREAAGTNRLPRGSMTSPAEATVLAFDFGTRRVGVAVGNTLVRIARPLATIDSESNTVRFAAIAALIEEWQPDQLVVGVPVHADGAPHDMTLRAQRFSRQLAGRFGLSVVEVDERYTTELAQSQAAHGGREGRGRRDEIAAQLILQAYFDERAAN